METNTFYYTISTIPQVIGAIVAILATFAHIRISQLREYLIGDGKSFKNRWGETGYYFPSPAENKKQKLRLDDAVARQNISEIKDVVVKLSIIEKDEGYTLGDRPTGLQYACQRFVDTENQINKLKSRTLCIIILSFITIIISILSLALTDIIFKINISYFEYYILAVNIILFIGSLFLTFKLMLLILSSRTLHETDR